MKKLILGMYGVGVLLIISGALTLFALGQDTTKASAQVRPGSFTVESLLPRTVENPLADTSVDLVIPTGGIVAGVLVENGDVVSAGQLLARLDSSQQEALLARARADLAQAESKLAQAIAAAEADLEAALNELAVIAQEFDARLRGAEDERAKAEDEYKEVFATYLGVELAHDQLKLAPQQVLQQAGIDLQTLFDPALRPSDYGTLVFTVPGVGVPQATVDDPQTPWDEALVHAWLTSYAGEIHVSFDETPETAPWALRARDEMSVNIAKDLSDAWAVLEGARVNIDNTQAERAMALVTAKENLSGAQEAVTLLGEAEGAAASDAVESARAGVEAAKARIARAEVEIEHTALYAPISGIVGSVNQAMNPGSWVAEGLVAVTLVV